MSIETTEHLTDRIELYELIQEGLNDVASGHVRPFAEAIAELKENRQKSHHSLYAASTSEQS